MYELHDGRLIGANLLDHLKEHSCVPVCATDLSCNGGCEDTGLKEYVCKVTHYQYDQEVVDHGWVGDPSGRHSLAGGFKERIGKDIYEHIPADIYEDIANAVLGGSCVWQYSGGPKHKKYDH